VVRTPGEQIERRAAREVEASGPWNADEALTALYAAHYRPLVRLSVLLLRDPGLAEEVVQDTFVAMHGRWGRLRDPDRALAYLRRTVVNRSRSALRRRGVEQRHVPDAPPEVPSAEKLALGALEHREVVRALRELSGRQREVLVLRYYADLSEAEIAAILGISQGAVKSHAFRGMATLRGSLGAGS
jgi:RNA polymerase sigma-70 factor (sigma-E family)